MNVKDVIGGGALGVVGLIVVRYALALSVGTWRHPGPGFFSLGLGMALVALSMTTVVQGLRAAEPARIRGAFVALPRILAVVAAMVGYGCLLPWLGFPASTFLLMWALFALASDAPRSWQPVVAGALTAALAYILFETLLGTGLPAGLLWGA
jgi:hypothetical protein